MKPSSIGVDELFDGYRYELEQRGLPLPADDLVTYQWQCEYWRERLRALLEQEAQRS
jgi:hypothetical protein